VKTDIPELLLPTTTEVFELPQAAADSEANGDGCLILAGWTRIPAEGNERITSSYPMTRIPPEGYARYKSSRPKDDPPPRQYVIYCRERGFWFDDDFVRVYYAGDPLVVSVTPSYTHRKKAVWRE
jgi:hypothetical protein